MSVVSASSRDLCLCDFFKIRSDCYFKGPQVELNSTWNWDADKVWAMEHLDSLKFRKPKFTVFWASFAFLMS